MSPRYKVMRGCECYIYAKSIHSSLLSWRERYLKNSRISAKMFKTEGLGKKKICIYETFKNAVMPHGRHIYAKAYDMAKATMCEWSQSYHALPHWKCVLRCCAKYPSINLPKQETYNQYSDTSPSIRFHIYHMIECCTKYIRLPLTENKSCHKCQQDIASRQ